MPEGRRWHLMIGETMGLAQDPYLLMAVVAVFIHTILAVAVAGMVNGTNEYC